MIWTSWNLRSLGQASLRIAISFLFVTSIQAQSKPTFLSNAEYDIYDAVLRHKFDGELADLYDSKMLVIREETVAGHVLGFPDGDWTMATGVLPGLKNITIFRFELANKTKGKLSRSFVIKQPYLLWSRRSYEAIFRMDLEKAWDTYHKKYPHSGGFLGLSRVGFDDSNTQALIYVQWSCGSLRASGHYILLTKRDAGWRVKGDWMPWIS